MEQSATGQPSGVHQKQVTAVLKLLKKAYPKASIALKYTNPWELLVSVILSAQCTDIMVNRVTGKLFAKYKTLDDYVNASSHEFEKDIRPTGFYHAKSKNILATARLVKEKFGGIVPKTMKDLLILKGVARKTANVVLGNAYGVVEGIAVDTHVLRISQRLRLVNLSEIGGKREATFQSGSRTILDYKKDADPVKIEQQLMRVFPKNEWFILTYLLIDHGRTVCKAKNPDCAHCALRTRCPVSRVNPMACLKRRGEVE